jgi:hypothetical protein
VPLGSIYYARTFINRWNCPISNWFRMLLTQLIIQVYKDSLTLKYPPIISIWLVLQFWYQSRTNCMHVSMHTRGGCTKDSIQIRHVTLLITCVHLYTCPSLVKLIKCANAQSAYIRYAGDIQLLFSIGHLFDWCVVRWRFNDKHHKNTWLKEITLHFQLY